MTSFSIRWHALKHMLQDKNIRNKKRSIRSRIIVTNMWLGASAIPDYFVIQISLNKHFVNACRVLTKLLIYHVYRLVIIAKHAILRCIIFSWLDLRLI